MSSSVITHDEPPSSLIYVQFNLITHTQSSLYISQMHNISTTDLHIFDSEFCCLFKKRKTIYQVR